MGNQRLKGHILIVSAGLCDSTAWGFSRFREVEKHGVQMEIHSMIMLQKTDLMIGSRD